MELYKQETRSIASDSDEEKMEELRMKTSFQVNELRKCCLFKQLSFVYQASCCFVLYELISVSRRKILKGLKGEKKLQFFHKFVPFSEHFNEIIFSLKRLNFCDILREWSFVNDVYL